MSNAAVLTILSLIVVIWLLAAIWLYIGPTEE